MEFNDLINQMRNSIPNLAKMQGEMLKALMKEGFSRKEALDLMKSGVVK